MLSNAELSQLLVDQESENLTSQERLRQAIETGMEKIIAKQLDAEIDIGND